MAIKNFTDLQVAFNRVKQYKVKGIKENPRVISQGWYLKLAHGDGLIFEKPQVLERARTIHKFGSLAKRIIYRNKEKYVFDISVADAVRHVWFKLNMKTERFFAEVQEALKNNTITEDEVLAVFYGYSRSEALNRVFSNRKFFNELSEPK